MNERARGSRGDQYQSGDPMEGGEQPSLEVGSESVVHGWFEEHRDYLRDVAYRMLGTLSDAEDVLQEAALRLSHVRADEVRQPRAYLAQLVTRLCVDQLRRLRVRRETYFGTWLPEPILGTLGDSLSQSPASVVSLREDVSLALLLALERLSPLERAAFILHDVFDMDYPEIAEALGRDEAACRQLAARGRQHVRDQRPRYAADPEATHRLLNAFGRAVMHGDLAGLERLLTDDVTLASDGGGRVLAATKVVRGRHNVARLIAGVARKFPSSSLGVGIPVTVNGQPGLVIREGGRVIQAVALEIEGERIAAFYVVRNPEKLRHLAAMH